MTSTMKRLSLTEVDLPYLPPSARTLITVIGIESTLQLMLHRRGQRFMVPRGKKLGGVESIERLVEEIGVDATNRLVAHYQGGWLDVPVCERAIRAARDRLICIQYDKLTGKGYSGREAINLLATQEGITFRTVARALKCTVLPQAVPDQIDMFAGSLD